MIFFFCMFGFVSTFPVSTLSFEITTLIGAFLTLHASSFIPNEEDAKAAIVASAKSPAAPTMTYSVPEVKGDAVRQPGESYKKLDTY